MNFYNANINFGWGERLNGWVNATVAMLPFMEQTARYDAYSEQAKNAPYGSWPWEIASDDVMTTPIPTLLRLSDGNASQPCSYKNYARTSIALSVGDGLWHNNAATCYTGVDIEKVGNRGFFAPLAWRPFSFVTDGLSQTVAISELTSDEAYSTKVKGESSRRRLSRAPFARSPVRACSKRSTRTTRRASSPEPRPSADKSGWTDAARASISRRPFPRTPPTARGPSGPTKRHGAFYPRRAIIPGARTSGWRTVRCDLSATRSTAAISTPRTCRRGSPRTACGARWVLRKEAKLSRSNARNVA